MLAKAEQRTRDCSMCRISFNVLDSSQISQILENINKHLILSLRPQSGLTMLTFAPATLLPGSYVSCGRLYFDGYFANLEIKILHNVNNLISYNQFRSVYAYCVFIYIFI